MLSKRTNACRWRTVNGQAGPTRSTARAVEKL